MAARVEILAVGSLHRDLEPAARHYLDLLKPLVAVTVREVKEVPLRGREPSEVLRDEGRRLLAAWPRTPVVAALAVEGRTLGTEAFAAWLQRGFERGGVGFVIGGSLGLGRRGAGAVPRAALAVGAHAAAPARARGAAGAGLPRRQDPAPASRTTTDAAAGRLRRAAPAAAAGASGRRTGQGRMGHASWLNERCAAGAPLDGRPGRAAGR